MKYALSAIGIFVAIWVLAAVIWGANFAWGWATAGPNGKLQARQSILSGPNRIVQYDHFFNLCASIQGLEGQLSAQQDELAQASADDKSRIQANIAGIKGERAQAIAEYNADAAKSYTSGQFRSSQLPYHLDVTEKETRCTA